jgi:hypothetical protein
MVPHNVFWTKLKALAKVLDDFFGKKMIKFARFLGFFLFTTFRQ